MQFFTKELWSHARDAHSEWQRAIDKYLSQLENLRERLSIETFRFFSGDDLHDGELLEISVVDGSRPAPLHAPRRPWLSPRNHPVKAVVTALDANEKYVWVLSYENVRRILVDYPSDAPLFHSEGEGFGDWAYHELTDADGGFLRHEILFATGATLLLEFKSVDLRCTPRTNR